MLLTLLKNWVNEAAILLNKNLKKYSRHVCYNVLVGFGEANVVKAIKANIFLVVCRTKNPKT